ncbi:aspartate/glutamate racemase family protein [Mycobacterium sp. 21AC1]|uniref:maleate cis-trans isomerase family protein n=1 Tax=[Mycobacterium] appelbergii TaxID=2939269 RepID=UPI002938D10B|nr:aspartate/glutamate racemase family protein [Mycobacterium sp. 21AC1]MDV3125416.1 aspartate/glutamate racemase family protein [Mycobacterium sp. 21AC1]
MPSDDPRASAPRIGMIVPSSNTCLEPTTYRMLGDRTDVSVHFTRIPVGRVGLDDSSDAQFDTAAMQAAAALLATAGVDVIAWNGTAGSWLGVPHDRAITDAITAATGVPALTTTQAYLAVFGALGVRNVGLVTPYPDDMNARIGQCYRDEDITVVAAHGFGLTETTHIARVRPEDLLAPSRQVAQSKPDAIAYVCTNLLGADAVEAVETELGVPVLDSVVITLAACLAVVGADPVHPRWGRHLAGASGLSSATIAGR